MERDNSVPQNPSITMIPEFDLDWDQFEYEWAIIRDDATHINYHPNIDRMETNETFEYRQSTAKMNSDHEFNDFDTWVNFDQDEESPENSQRLTTSPLTSWPGSASTSTISPTSTPTSSTSPLIATQTPSPRAASTVKIAPKPTLLPLTQTPTHPYACLDCPSTFARKCDLTRHARQHLRPISCLVHNCPERKATKRDMERHVITRHPKSDIAKSLLLASQFPCEAKECRRAGVVFHRRDHLVRHQRKVHGERKVP